MKLTETERELQTKVDSLARELLKTLIRNEMKSFGPEVGFEERGERIQRCRNYYPAIASTLSEQDVLNCYAEVMAEEDSENTVQRDYLLDGLQSKKAELEEIQLALITDDAEIVTRTTGLQAQMDEYCHIAFESVKTIHCVPNNIIEKCKTLAKQIDRLSMNHPLARVTHERVAHLVFYVTMAGVNGYLPDSRWIWEKRWEYDRLVKRYQ